MKIQAASRFHANIIVIVLLGLQTAFSLKAQNAEPGIEKGDPPSLFDLFYLQPDSLPLLQIETDWGQLIRAKQKEEYQPGVLRFRSPNGKLLALNAELRARGNTRKKVCLFPPLKIKPEKQQSIELGFNPRYKLKLVLPCQPGASHEDCLLREALAYQLYEMIYPVHFRTRIVKVQCWQNDKEKHSLYAFLVEEEEELAARLDGRLLPEGEMRAAALERGFYLKMCFFQYMIANTDWSVANRHNLHFLQLPGYQRVVAVPYDFDYAGLVNTTYAVPASTLPIDDVSQRHFLGERITAEEAMECAGFFLARKDQILGHCRSFSLLREKPRGAVHNLLSEFFDILEDQQLVIRTFANAEAPD